jgi:hypothetical protein
MRTTLIAGSLLILPELEIVMKAFGVHQLADGRKQSLR